MVIVDEGWKTGGISAEIAATVAEEAIWELDAPVGRVCSAEVPIPYARHMEEAALPQASSIVAKAKALMGR
jgi:pyruvate/2-oxoglutarate/acetoin dehydrogenase E1 component